MNQLQLVSRIVSKQQGPTSLLALANIPHGMVRPTIQQATLLMALMHAVANKIHYHETMSTQERIACAFMGIVEHFCNNRHIKRSYNYMDASTAYYDSQVLTGARYPDLHPQNQAKNYSPTIEKLVTGVLPRSGSC